MRRQTDERIDRHEDEDERERVLPERHADEGAAGREHERRAQREHGEQAREGPSALLESVANPAQ